MEPQDDPEARIRDLERPLAYQADTSELGAGQYGGGYATTPQWSSTAPLPPPPPAPTSGTRGWWVLPVAVGFVLLAVIGGIAFYLMSSGGTSTTTGGRPTYSGGGGSVTSSPMRQPPATVPETEIPLPPSVPSSPTAAPGVNVNISGVGGNREVACDNGSINVSGVSNVVNITGHCAELSVSGVGNTITIDSADAIGVSGFDNRITYHTGAPQVENSGGSNEVGQG